MIGRILAIVVARTGPPCVRPILTGIGIALGLGVGTISEAHASTYRVSTNSAASSMILNASDGFCSLAEAVQHANGNAIYNCTDHDPGSTENRIELLQSANRPLSTNHFEISTLTINNASKRNPSGHLRRAELPDHRQQGQTRRGHLQQLRDHQRARGRHLLEYRDAGRRGHLQHHHLSGAPASAEWRHQDVRTHLGSKFGSRRIVVHGAAAQLQHANAVDGATATRV